MINPLSVLIAIPCHDGRLESACAGGLAACASEHLFGNFVFLNHCTGPQLARDLMVHGFLKGKYEWLVFIDSDIGFSANDFKLLLDYPPHQKIDPSDISCAEYARKNDAAPPARFGLGFCKIHRSVFEALDKLDNVDGSARVDSFMHGGELVKDYFISGCLGGKFYGEDTGFFTLVSMAGIVPRVEKRTQLIHIGKREYRYDVAKSLP